MCPICSGQSKLYLDYQKISKGDYRLWRCEKCGLIYTEPLPSPGFLADFYQTYDSFGVQDNYYRDLKNYGKTRAGRELTQEFSRLAKQYGFRRDRKILDLGSGGGMFLDIATRAGFPAVGVEVSHPAAEFAINNFGVDCVVGDVLSFEIAEKFGAVFMWDLLEHLPRPEELLVRIGGWLDRGGYLIFETPNSEALINKIIILLLKLGITWPAGWMFGYHHLFWHSRQSLELMLTRCHFEILEVRLSNTLPERIFPWSLKFFLPRLALIAVNAAAAVVGRKNKILIIARKSEN